MYKSKCVYNACNLGCNSAAQHRAKYASFVYRKKNAVQPNFSPKINYGALAFLR